MSRYCLQMVCVSSQMAAAANSSGNFSRKISKSSIDDKQVCTSFSDILREIRLKTLGFGGERTGL